MRNELLPPIRNAAISGYLPPEDAELLRFYLTKKEIRTAIRFCEDLLEHSDIESIIYCAQYDFETFCEAFCISNETLENRIANGMTEFERETIIFELILADILFDRIHYCPNCYAYFLSTGDQGDLCSDCAEY